MTCKPQPLAPTNWNTVPPDPDETPGRPVVETLARVALLAIVVALAIAVIVAFMSEPGPMTPYALRYLTWCAHTVRRGLPGRTAPGRRG